MLLSVAASYFDDVLCQDAFNANTKFYGQLDVYDDSRRDGATVVRRILSVAGGTALPARRVLAIHGEQWIVGTHEADSFKGSIVRDKHILQRAQGACSIRTPAQALSSGGVSSYGAKLWVKDMKEVESSSKLSGFFNLYLPSAETVSRGDLVQLGGREHIVRNAYLSAAGFLVAESDELDAGAIAAATFTPYSYSPATDGVIAGTPVAVQALRMRFQDDYEYPSDSAPKFVSGDIRVFVRKGVTLAAPAPRDTLTLTDGIWQVQSVSDETGCWGLHLRKAPA